MIRARRSRIVATLGPASRAPETVEALARAGADVFRLNFSHGAHADHAAALEAVRAAETATSTTTAALAATTVAAVSMQRTYRVDRQPTFATTGVLTAVQANLGIFGDVEARSAQVAPYLRNLIVLSEALQEKYTETSLEREVAVRVLLVSDVHASNLYPLMRSIVQEEEIEFLFQLLTTIGALLDTPEACAHMDVYFSRMKELTKSPNVNSRMQFMLQVRAFRFSRFHSIY